MSMCKIYWKPIYERRIIRGFKWHNKRVYIWANKKNQYVRMKKPKCEIIKVCIREIVKWVNISEKKGQNVR